MQPPSRRLNKSFFENVTIWHESYSVMSLKAGYTGWFMPACTWLRAIVCSPDGRQCPARCAPDTRRAREGQPLTTCGTASPPAALVQVPSQRERLRMQM